MADFDKAVRLPSLYAYHLMLIAAGSGVAALQHWLHACPCHHARLAHLPRGSVSNAFRKLNVPDLRGSCPMVGRWAPEMAVGEHLRIIQQASLASRSGLLASLFALPDLSQEDCDSMLFDLDVFVQHIDAVVTVKLGYVTVLPCALGRSCRSRH